MKLPAARSILAPLLALPAALGAGPVLAQGADSNVVVDGKLPGTSFEALPGPDYQLTAEDHGLQTGGNLLFSLQRLGLDTGESLSISGPESVDRVVTRVTGPEASSIDGTLRNTIDGASLYLLNPNGIFFGENAQLDTRGAFYASTADLLEFEDGAEFHATFPERDTPFSTAPISAFGFLSENPAGITVEGSKLVTASFRPNPGAPVAIGADLALVGGDVEIRGLSATEAVLYTGGGRLDLASLASPGRVQIVQEDPAAGVEADLHVAVEGELGDIAIVDGAIVATGGPPPGEPLTHVNGSGDVFIRARGLLLREAEVRSLTTTGQPAGRIDVALTGDFVADAAGSSKTTGLAAGSGLIVGDPDAPVSGSPNVVSAVIETGDPSSASRIVQWFDERGETVRYEHQLGRGETGRIRVAARNVSLLGGAKLSSSGVFGGDGGDITVDATGTVLLSGVDADGEEGGIFANAQLEGDAGFIEITAPDLVVEEGAGVFTEVRRGDGTGGDIAIDVDRLLVESAGRIDTSTRGTGPGGTITVQASESIFLDGVASEIATISHEEASGTAGRLRIEAPRVRITNGAGITTEARFQGDAGVVDLRGDRIKLVRGRIAASADDGAGGDIYVNGGPIRIEPDGRLSIDKLPGVEPGRELLLDQSQITTSVTSNDPLKGGGNVAIDPKVVSLRRSNIVANGVQGPGGNIRLVARRFVADNESTISAVSQFSEDGIVDISSEAGDLRSQLKRVPSDIVDAVVLLRERCAARVGGDAAGSFVLSGRDGVPASPEGFLPAFHRLDRATPGSASTPDASARVPLEIEPAAGGLRVRCGEIRAG